MTSVDGVAPVSSRRVVHFVAYVELVLFLVGACVLMVGTTLPWQTTTGYTYVTSDAFDLSPVDVPKWLPVTIVAVGVVMVVMALVRLIDRERTRLPARAPVMVAILAGAEMGILYRPLEESLPGLPSYEFLTILRYGYWVSAAGAALCIVSSLCMASTRWGYRNLARAPKPRARVAVPTTVVDGVLFEDPTQPGGRAGWGDPRRTTSTIVLLGAFEAVAIAYALAGTYRVAFIIAAVLVGQLLVVVVRTRSLSGPTCDDLRDRERVAAILRDLCTTAVCAVPFVVIRRSGTPAGVTSRRKHLTLMLSEDLLRATDDEELRAVVAHEVIHLKHRDLSAIRHRMIVTVVVLYVLGAVGALGIASGSNAVVLLACVLFLPSLRVANYLTGFAQQPRERRADLEGATMTGDTDAMCRGLTAVHAMAHTIRAHTFGEPPWRWALFPVVLPGSTHPGLTSRVEGLRSAAASVSV
jgi:Zn-dependent protease with chaperone function